MVNKTLCGYHAANVVISEYNENGECKCLGCAGCRCQTCEQRTKLIQESWEKNEVRLERCMACLKQK